MVPCQTIDVHFKQWVDGCPSYNVTVNDTSRLWIHYDGYEPTDIPARPSVSLHVVNDLCAVIKDAQPTEKLSQVPSFDEEPVKQGESYPLLHADTLLDIETAWQLEKCLNYTKTINWLGVSSFYVVKTHLCVLFELRPQSPGTYHFTLTASAEVALVNGESGNHRNDSAMSPH